MMKKSTEKKEFFEKEIDEITFLTKESELVDLNERVIKNFKGQTLQLTNYPYLEHLYEVKKRYHGKELLLYDLLYLSYLVMKEPNYSLGVKKDLYKAVLALFQNVKKEFYFSQNSLIIKKEISILEKIEEEKRLAHEVMEEIFNLEVNEEVLTVLSHYNSLPDSSKVYVENAKDLFDIKARYDAMMKAKELDQEIERMGEVSLENRQEIKRIYDCYLLLEPLEKEYVTNKKMLLDSMDIINRLELEKSKQNVATLFDNEVLLTESLLEEEYKFDVKLASIKSLVELYGSCDEVTLNFITTKANYDLILEKRNGIEKENQLFQEALLLKQEIADLSPSILNNDLEYLVSLKERYLGLKYMSLVGNIQALENHISIISAKENSKVFDQMIESISLDTDFMELEKAECYYEGLSEFEKSFVQMYSEYLHLKCEFDKQNESINRSKQLEKDILALKPEMHDLKKIEALQGAYQNLSELEKTYVKNYYLLTNCYEETIAYQKAMDLVNKIDLLEDVTLKDLPALEEMSYLYECLSDYGKNFVSNIDILEEKICYLNQMMDQVESISNRIANLGEITLNSQEEVSIIKRDFILLDSYSESLVKNSLSLFEAENKILNLANYEKRDKDHYLDLHLANLEVVMKDPFIGSKELIQYMGVIYALYQDLEEKGYVDLETRRKVQEVFKESK